MAKSGIIVIAAAIVAAVVLIGGSLYWSNRPRQFVFDIEFYNTGRIGQPAPEMKVLIDGHETPLAGTRDGDPYVTATGGTGTELNDDVLPAIQVQYRYACGWKAVKIEAIDLPRDDQVRLAKQEGRNTPLHVALSEDGAAVTLYVDDRGEGAHMLGIGGATAAIAAGSSTSVDLAADMRCAAGRAVTLDGKSIGTLPGDPPRGGTTTHFLFDASGKRCYVYRQVAYVGKNDIDMDPDRTPEVFHFAGAALYALPDGRIDFFLEEPPQQIMVPENATMPGMAYIQSSLLETPCSYPAAKSAAKRKPR